jgi:hypothetical protein
VEAAITLLSFVLKIPFPKLYCSLTEHCGAASDIILYVFGNKRRRLAGDITAFTQNERMKLYIVLARKVVI